MDEWILNVIQAAGYAGIAFLMLIESLVPAIPSELILPFAGYLVARQELDFLGVVVSGTAGATAGASGWYVLGRAWGEDRVHQWLERHGHWLLLEANDVRKAEQWFDRHQRFATFTGRLVPGVRSLISMPAGVARMNLPRFLFYTVAGSAIWTVVLTCAGYVLADAYERARDVVGPIGTIVFAGVVVALIVRYVRRQHQAA